MATQQEKIKQMYDELYKSKYDQLLKEKENKLNGLDSQRKQIDNTFTNTKSEIERQREDVTNRYNQKYSELENDAAKGKEKYYGDRNNAAYSHAKNTQSTRDYMAKQNLLQSGESVDAMLRGNTDFSNTLGEIYGAEQNFNKGIADTRSKYTTEQNSYYGQLDNSLNSALSERDRLLAALESEKNSILSGFDGSLGALQSEIKNQAMKDIMAYEEQLRQEAYQKQMEEERRKWEAEQDRIKWERQIEEQKRQEAVAAASRSYSGGGSSGGGYSSGGSTSYSKSGANTYSDAIENAFQTAYKSKDINSAAEIMNDAKIALAQGYISQQKYNSLLNHYNGLQKKASSSYKPSTSSGRNNYASAW